ncbi:Transcriptional regulator, AbiEi antitoxin, Type IV TA system [Agreia pratensis]|uniref:Transcriptional regulator, AbiEi antitoxin, Type IV TA system n=2 Tax=Agreia pratensis TaxID=150121 RepID=A0A1X7I3U8_9MICO|nr:Transcriptional regulator, AbiEi antitoxin, Type IV TA system [Agreia pratensis]
MPMDTPSPDGSLVFARDVRRTGHNPNALTRAVRRDELARIAPGSYMSRQHWDALNEIQRTTQRARAASERWKSAPVFSHWTAAAIHGIPLIGAWPTRLHVIIDRASTVRSRGEIVRHAIGVDADDVVLIDGMLVTSVARTVLDLAADATFMSAVTAADFALCHKRETRIEKAELAEIWENRLPFRGHVRARRVLDFATHLAESPLESGSRVNMHLLGFPAPELQVEWRDYRGLIGYSDFFWREFNRVGEADGRAKYFDDELARGRSLKQIVFDEKIREDRIRALGPGFSRWDWNIGMNPRRLKPFLLAAGLPIETRR